jgi:hypothetical protein
MPHPPRQPDREWVDLANPVAVQRAIALHQAGQAVFAVPFGSAGNGTLTWLDPRRRHIHDESSLPDT